MKLTLPVGKCIGHGFANEACTNALACAVGMDPKAFDLPRGRRRLQLYNAENAALVLCDIRRLAED